MSVSSTDPRAVASAGTADVVIADDDGKIRFEIAPLSRKPQYKDVYRRTIEIPQRARTFKVNYCLKVHNAHQKLLSPISGYVISNLISVSSQF